MKIDSITDGIVIDHIRAGGAMELYRLLGLGTLDCPVAIIKNAPSQKLGKKDIIKIDSDLEIHLDVLGFVDPDATINVIRGGVLVEKKHAGLPERITSAEPDLPQIFKLSNRETKTYRCIYCEAKAER